MPKRSRASLTLLGLNEVQEDNADAKRNKGSNHVGKFVSEVVGAPPLGDCEGGTDNQSVHPAVAQAFLAVQDQDNQQRNKESEERCLAANGRRQRAAPIRGQQRHRRQQTMLPAVVMGVPAAP